MRKFVELLRRFAGVIPFARLMQGAVIAIQLCAEWHVLDADLAGYLALALNFILVLCA